MKKNGYFSKSYICYVSDKFQFDNRISQLRGVHVESED